MSAVLNGTLSGVDHCGLRARTALMAVKVSVAKTATLSSSLTTCLTPGMAMAGAASTEISLPPNTGDLRLEAWSMPGTRTSRP